MNRYNFKSVVIERHVLEFDGLPEEKVISSEYSPEELESEKIFKISGKEFASYILTVQNIDEEGIAFFEEIRSEEPTVVCSPYESRGVIILCSGDVHKTPVQNYSYNVTYWFEVHVNE